MANFLICSILQKVFHPLILCACIAFRPVGISLIYLAFVLLLPFVPVIQPNNLKGSSRVYFLLLLVVSSLLILCQIVLQIIWALKDQHEWIRTSEFTSSLRQVGYVDFQEIRALLVVQWLLPDIVVFFSTSFIFLMLKSFCKSRKDEQSSLRGVSTDAIHLNRKSSKKEVRRSSEGLTVIRYKKLRELGKFSSLATLCLAGVVQPSIPNGVYFLAFLSFSTWLACNRQLHWIFAWTLRILSVIMAIHIVFIVFLQIHLILEVENDTLLEVMGTDVIYSSNLTFNSDLDLTIYLNPLILILTYYVITTTSEFMLNSMKLEVRAEKYEKEHSDDLESRRVSFNDVMKRIMSKISKTNQETKKEIQSKTIAYLIQRNLTNFFCQNAYIITNGCMMIWSVLYHSILGFILLIWANLIWVRKDRRIMMMTSSPFLVIFADLLLIINYLMAIKYIDVSKHITPTHITQLGFEPDTKAPGLHLLLKSVFLVSFWVTSRLYFQERLVKRHRKALSFEETVQVKVEVEKSKARKSILRFDMFQKVLMLSFMWIIILLLFLTAIYGGEITFFSFANMTFCLVFLLLCHLSFKLWLQSMYVFWLSLIMYAVCALTMIYGYQFEKFIIFKPFLNAIGLQKLEAKMLLAKLLSFTFVIFLTGIQMNKFHFQIMLLFDEKKKEDTENLETSPNLQKKANRFKTLVEKVFLFLEIHMYKFLSVVIFSICASHFHIFNVLIMMLLILSAHATKEIFKAFFLKFILVLLMIFICFSMLVELYQCIKSNEILDTNSFSATTACTNRYPSNLSCNTTININSPISMMKFSQESTLTWLNINSTEKIKENIEIYFGIIVIVTIFSGIKIHQKMERVARGEPKQTPELLFANISRLDADESLLNFLKFLLNYGFYKFGIEATLLTFVYLVYIRHELFSMFYLTLFIVLALSNRKNAQRFWNLTINCISISMYLQCFLLLVYIAFKPCQNTLLGLKGEISKLFPYFYSNLEMIYKEPNMILADFILLITMICQQNAFEKEKARDEGRDPFVGGGSNITVLKQSMSASESVTLPYSHPIYTFKEKLLGFVDIFKRYLFKFHIWISLAFIFIESAYRVDIFSFGYIGICFVFFWRGSDFFMKQLKTIVRWWNLLLIYNVCVITIKLLIDFFGCRVSDKLPSQLCVIAFFSDAPCSNEMLSSEFCFNSKTKTVYFYDLSVFATIIVQRRILHSYYFFNYINETFLTSILASRGAEMLEAFRIREANKEIESEAAYLEEIKEKMESIKESAMNLSANRTSLCHDRAIMSGGYFMFNDDDVGSHEIITTKLDLTDETKSETKQNMKFNQADKTSHATYKAIVNKSKTIKEFFLAIMKKLMLKMHKLSKNYSFIMTTMAQEKRMLKESLTPAQTDSSFTVDYKMSCLNRDKQVPIIRKIENKLKRMTLANINEATKPEFTPLNIVKEMFYLVMSQSNFLVYLAVIIVQIKTSSMLSIPLSLLVFLWATLTYPRPPRTFWVILIAYTQLVILIKALSQLKLAWWNPQHDYFVFLGIEKMNNFSISEVLLLMTILLHRNILRRFGLWTGSNWISTIQEGNYELENCNLQAVQMIAHSLELGVGDDQEDWEEKEVESFDDEDFEEEEEKEEEALFRHELVTMYDQDGKEVGKKIKSVYKKRTEIINAAEDIFEDYEGKIVIKLVQDDIKIRLRSIDTTFEKSYTASEILQIETVIEEPFDFFPWGIFLSFKQYFYIVRNLFKMFNPKRTAARKSVDVYKYMFFCDFINFFVVLLGFPEFATNPSSGNKLTIFDYIEQNKVPLSLLGLIGIQFFMIITDRLLYIRKAMTGKIIFHIASVIYIHAWLLFFLPLYFGRSLKSSVSPLIYYFIKCIYFLLSAYQIRYGYPARILGNFLTKKFTLFNTIAFKIFMAIPLLFELRTVLDWMFVKTSLTFKEWVRVEAIYAQIYKLKTDRIREYNANPRGEKYPSSHKMLQGGAITAVLIGVLWFPLLFFAYPSLGEANVPVNVKVMLQIGIYEPIYRSEVSQFNVRLFTDKDWQNLTNLVQNNYVAMDFLKDYDSSDVVALQFQISSSTSWDISPPNKKQMIEDIKSKMLRCRFEFSVVRNGQVGREELVTGTSHELDEKVRADLIEMLSTNETTSSVKIPFLLPKVMTINNNGKFETVADRFFSAGTDPNQNLTIRLNNLDQPSWWEVSEVCEESSVREFFDKFPYQNCKDIITVFLFSEKMIPAQLNMFAVKGIVSLYITLMLFLSRFLRSTIYNFETVTIIVEEIPNVDRIYNLCNDIYLVRESQEFSLEEDLVAKLLFLYRSPELLIKWTQLKD